MLVRDSDDDLFEEVDGRWQKVHHAEDPSRPDIEGVCEALTEYAKARRHGLREALHSCPQLLLLAPTELTATLGWLEERAIDARRLVQLAPQVLLVGAEPREALLAFLAEEAGFDPPQVASALSDFPMLLTYDPQTELAPLIAFLKDRGVDPAAEACRGLFAWPNTERRLAPALELLTASLAAPWPEHELLAEPLLLCYSFDLRIRPRALFLDGLFRSSGRPDGVNMTLLSTATDEEFCAAVGVEPEVYGRFRKELRS